MFPRIICSLALVAAVPGFAHAAAAQRTQIADHAPATLVAGARGKSDDAPERFTLRFGSRTVPMTVSDNVRLVAGLDDAQRAQVDGTDNRYLEGTIDGVAGSWVRLSRVAGRWTGAFYDGVELHLVDRTDAVADKLQKAAPAADALVVYRMSDIAMPAVDGGGRMSYAQLGQELQQVASAIAAPDAATKQLNITIVTDTQYTAVHGGNANAVVASRINTVDGIYSDQVGVRMVAANIRNLTNNGTLTTTNPTQLVSDFRVYMTSGAGSSIPKGGINHLFSGKDFDGSTVGVAYLGVLCNTSYGYGINQVRDSSQTTALTVAHEMGHNFGAPHDGEGACAAEPMDGIMNPFINGSTTFSPCSRTQMADDVAAATCMIPISGGAPPLIFANGFD